MQVSANGVKYEVTAVDTITNQATVRCANGVSAVISTADIDTPLDKDEAAKLRTLSTASALDSYVATVETTKK